MSLENAIEKLRQGEFVLIHDPSERENETDMVIAAEMVEPRHVARMRREGGGLICAAIRSDIADRMGLPYLRDIYESASSEHQILEHTQSDDIPYDERSAFSIPVNHRDTFTGITDEDRALTISELGELSSKSPNDISPEEFGKKFRTPGHVPLLKAASGLLENRQGHTELSVALMEMAGLAPASVVCEMMDGETKKALDTEGAKSYAEKNDLVFLEGREILKAYFEREDF